MAMRRNMEREFSIHLYGEQLSNLQLAYVRGQMHNLTGEWAKTPHMEGERLVVEFERPISFSNARRVKDWLHGLHSMCYFGAKLHF